MSDNKRRSLVFWPRVDHSDSSSDTEWEDAPLQQLSDKGDSTPLGEGSDPESDAQFRLMAERSKYKDEINSLKVKLIVNREKPVSQMIREPC